MRSIEFYIRKLGLKPLLSNDYLMEFYRSDYKISVNREERDLCSWAYYLMPGGCVFPFHKMGAISSWQYCAGDPLELFLIEGKDKLLKLNIGPDLSQGHTFVHVTPGDTWFAAKTKTGDGFTLISHCIVPGFKVEDEVCGFYEDIIQVLPDHPLLVKELSCEKSKTDQYLLQAMEYEPR